ncbi:MAG: hypothetical protein K6G00_09620, partial [Treponema sp.]|nr:hypothetical protein [Treponema sp.]
VGLVGAEVATSTALQAGNCLTGFSEVTGFCATTATGATIASATTTSGQKLLQQLSNFRQDKINHIVNGSKGHDHCWDKLVPNKNWNDIKALIFETMEKGSETSYGTAFKNTLKIGEETIVVTFQKLENGVKAISDAWIVKD